MWGIYHHDTFGWNFFFHYFIPSVSLDLGFLRRCRCSIIYTFTRRVVFSTKPHGTNVLTKKNIRFFFPRNTCLVFNVFLKTFKVVELNFFCFTMAQRLCIFF